MAERASRIIPKAGKDLRAPVRGPTFMAVQTGVRRIARDLLPLLRQALGDRYEIDREVGRGGAARVFIARDTASDAPVALKILRPELLTSVTAERFLREIAVMVGIDHPNIAKLLDYGEREWLVYYVMPFIEGPTVRQHLERVRHASPSDTERIATDLLDALAYAHERGIVHRDVKPENIVLSNQGAVLLDFGISRAIAATGSERLTRSGFTVGTSYYMSPEQTLGAADIDHRSDLYSLGCVLFECLAGRPPFADRSEAVVLHLQQTAPAPNVREYRADTPVGLAKAIERALVKEPKERWQSAREMLAAVAES